MKSGDVNLELQIIQKQKQLCEKFGAGYEVAPFDKLIGVAISTFETGKLLPINGFRHPVESVRTVNWYLWAGEEFSEAPDFFKPMHLHHLLNLCPKALDYLGLAPGWRFLFDVDYEDVWYDEALLDI